jgi:HK97 family phage portal protein
MKILGLNLSLPSFLSRRSAPASPEVGVPHLTPAALAWLRGEYSPESAGPRLVSAYDQVVWVYRAVNAIAEQVANIPFCFSRGERGRESLITSGPLIDFYSHPHPRINAFQYWELRVLWLLLRGECIRIPVFQDDSRLERTVSGFPLDPLDQPLPGTLPNHATGGRPTKSQKSKIKNILFLDPLSFQHVIRNHQLLGWRYTGHKDAPLESQVFLPEDVWFDRLPHPYDFWRGLSPLVVAAMACRTDFAASTFMYGLMDNNADAGLIVRSEQELTDQQQEQIVAALKNRRCQAGAANRSLFLWGATDIVAPRLSSADLQFLENRKLSRAEICSALGVPEEIVTTTDHNKYDVMQGARLNFIENRIAPLCARLEAEEQRVVKAIDPTAVGWFDLDALPIMQQARRNRLAAAKVGFDMGIPFNELNKAFDLGFKPLPWGNTGYLPAKYQPLTPQSSSSASAPASSSSSFSSSSSDPTSSSSSSSPAHLADSLAPSVHDGQAAGGLASLAPAGGEGQGEGAISRLDTPTPVIPSIENQKSKIENPATPHQVLQLARELRDIMSSKPTTPPSPETPPNAH